MSEIEAWEPGADPMWGRTGDLVGELVAVFTPSEAAEQVWRAVEERFGTPGDTPGSGGVAFAYEPGQIVLISGGEDAVDSLEFSSRDIADIAREVAPDARLQWQQRPWKPAS